jgi:hypothetical protein
MCNILISFYISTKLSAITYDYIQLSHTIYQKRGPNPQPELVNIILNSTHVTSKPRKNIRSPASILMA